MWLTLFPVLYITALWFIYFYNWEFAPLNPLHLFFPYMHPHLPQCPLTCGNHWFVLWVCFCFVIFVHLFWFLDSTHKWKLWHFSFWFWMFFCIIYSLPRLIVSFIPGISNQRLIPINLHPLIFEKKNSSISIVCSFLLVCWLACWMVGWLDGLLFRAISTAYGSSQARGQMGTAATTTPQQQQCGI